MSSERHGRQTSTEPGEATPLRAEPEATIRDAGEAWTILSELASALYPHGLPDHVGLTWAEDPTPLRPDSTDEIDERKRAEARLRSAEARYRTLIEQIPAVTFMAVLGEGQNEIYVSPHIEALLGFTQREWLEDPFLWYSQLHPADRQLWNEEFARGCRTGGPFRAECRFLSRDGRVVWVRGEARLVRDDRGRPQFLQGVAFDITETKRAEALMVRNAIQTTEDRYRDLVEGLGATVWEADPIPFKFTFISPRVEDVLGFPASRWTGEPEFWRGRVHPDDRSRLAAQWLEAAKRGGTHTFEYRAFAADGRLMWLHDNVRVVPSSDRRGPQLLGLMLDVTERKRADDERARLYRVVDDARRAAEQANQTKDEFLATISHELRTPLNAVLGWARLLGTGSLDNEQRRRALQIIERNADAQVQLIEDVLDVSRIRSGKLRLEVGPVDLIAVIDAATDAVRPAAVTKGIELQSSLDPAARVAIGDATRLQQVVWNLLSNAVKFTPNGGQVNVRLERAMSGARIVVADTGAGIPAEFLPYVFDRFRQADSSTTRRHGGLGLGLAVVRHLVELHGGMVSAQSAGEGQGAIFTVEIPTMAAAEATFPPLSAPPARDDALEGVTVLLVDDDASARDLLTMMLTPSGALITAVGSAAEALDVLDRTAPTILISDIGMPVTDGYALISEVRARGHRVPAIALTAYARAEDRARALEAGFQAHVTKPIDPVGLAGLIATLTGRAAPDS